MGTPIYADSSPIALDTRAPQSISYLNLGVTSGNTVFCAWDVATDANFDHYEIWYGTNQSDVQNRTGTAVKWDDGDDANLVNVGTTSTSVTGVPTGTDLYFSIFAIDDFNQVIRVDAASTINTLIEDTSILFDLDTRPPQGLGNFAVTILTSTSIQCTWDAVSDTNFSHYEIWFGSNEFDVQNRTGASVEWNDGDDGNLASAATITTTITSGFSAGDTLYFSIFAVDDFGALSQADYGSPLTVFDTTGKQFDGATIVYSEATTGFDAYIKVFSTNPNNWFGSLLVYDEQTESFDGASHVGIDATANTDGSLDVNAIVDRLFNGSLYVHEVVTVQFDGSLLMLSNVSTSFNGTLTILKAVTNLFNGVLSVVLTASSTFNGQIEITGPVAVFDGSLSVEVLPELVLFRPRDGADNVTNTTNVHGEFLGYPDVTDGGLDFDSLVIVMLTPELVTIYDGGDPFEYPDVTVSGDASRLSVDFGPPLEDGTFGETGTVSFTFTLANEAGQSVEFAYSFDLREGPGAPFSYGSAVYEYDMGTTEVNITEFSWEGNGLSKMRLKFADTISELHALPFDGEEHVSFRGTTVAASIWNVTAPVFALSQNEVLTMSGTQSGAVNYWDNETRLIYTPLLPSSYNIAVDTRLNITKAAVSGAQSFLEIFDTAGTVLRLEKMYMGLPQSTLDGTGADIVPDEDVEVKTLSSTLSNSSIFPQTVATSVGELVFVDITVVNNNVPLEDLERVRVRFGAGEPNQITVVVNGVHTASGIVRNTSGDFEATEVDIFPIPLPPPPPPPPVYPPIPSPSPPVLETVRILFYATDTQMEINVCEVLVASQIVDTRMRVMLNGHEEFDINVPTDPLRYDQLKVEVERRSFDVYFNGESVFRRSMRLLGPKFAIGATARQDGDVLVADFDNLVLRRYYDRSPVPLNVSRRYVAYEITLKAPKES